VLAGTPASSLGIAGGCASLGAPGPVLFERPPGEHTYELRYAVCGCPGGTGTATFSDRLLVVRPVP
jgi:hypothetical protein